MQRNRLAAPPAACRHLFGAWHTHDYCERTCVQNCTAQLTLYLAAPANASPVLAGMPGAVLPPSLLECQGSCMFMLTPHLPIPSMHAGVVTPTDPTTIDDCAQSSRWWAGLHRWAQLPSNTPPAAFSCFPASLAASQKPRWRRLGVLTLLPYCSTPPCSLQTQIGVLPTCSGTPTFDGGAGSLMSCELLSALTSPGLTPWWLEVMPKPTGCKSSQGHAPPADLPLH